jgi:tetratricopeptide (TPR) repeat protein
MILYFSRQYDEAIEQCRKTLELDQNMETAYPWLVGAYEQKKLYDQSVAAHLKKREVSGASPEELKSLRETYAASGWEGFWRKVLDLDEQKSQGINTSWLAEVCARIGENERAFAFLEKAYEKRLTRMKFLNTDPIWDSLRPDPRYIGLVRRMGLEP